jgi:hypothetical protein
MLIQQLGAGGRSDQIDRTTPVQSNGGLRKPGLGRFVGTKNRDGFGKEQATDLPG